MKVFLDEFFFAIWMKVYLTVHHTPDLEFKLEEARFGAI